MPSNVSLPDFTHFPAEEATKKARSLAEEMRGTSLSGSHPGAVLLKSMSGPDCWAFRQDADARARWSNQVRALYDVTLQFLPPDLLQGVWVAPAWQRCTTLGPDFQRVLDMIASHARRDYVAMERLGREWLTNKPSQGNAFLRRDFDPVALSGLLLALVHQQRWGDIEAALDQYRAVPAPDQEHRAQRELIAALARTQKNPSSGM